MTSISRGRAGEDQREAVAEAGNPVQEKLQRNRELVCESGEPVWGLSLSREGTVGDRDPGHFLALSQASHWLCTLPAVGESPEPH